MQPLYISAQWPVWIMFNTLAPVGTLWNTLAHNNHVKNISFSLHTFSKYPNFRNLLHTCHTAAHFLACFLPLPSFIILLHYIEKFYFFSHLYHTLKDNPKIKKFGRHWHFFYTLVTEILLVHLIIKVICHFS